MARNETDVACKAFAYDPLGFSINLAPSVNIFNFMYEACCKKKDFCPVNTPWYLFYLGKWLPVVITLIAVFGAFVMMKRKERMRFKGPQGAGRFGGAPGAGGGGPGTTVGTGTTETDYYGVPKQ